MLVLMRRIAIEVQNRRASGVEPGPRAWEFDSPQPLFTDLRCDVLRARRTVLGLSAVVLAAGVAIGAVVVARRARAPSAASSSSPCDRYRPVNNRVGWACFPNGAPVDVVTEQSFIVTVLHRPSPVLVIDTEPLDPTVPIADPKRPPVRICVLSGGYTGFISPAALHEAPCRE